MDRLRKVFDDLKPKFSKGGKYEKWWTVFDVIENFILKIWKIHIAKLICIMMMKNQILK